MSPDEIALVLEITGASDAATTDANNADPDPAADPEPAPTVIDVDALAERIHRREI